MSNRLAFKVLFLVLCLSCSKNEGTLFSALDAEKSGITFKNNLSSDKKVSILDYLYYYNGGGVAIGDINNDNLPDIFFTGNQVKNKLFLNQGNLKFKDITDTSGVQGNSDWNTGSVMADVNGDGLLDIYVCAVSRIFEFKGRNELYINNGDNTFTEKSKEFGLDFENYSTSAVFLDYDLDGDLDMYLLNHALHNQESFGKAYTRNNRVERSGDKFLRNNGNNRFEDVSEEAGVFGGANGYGLGVAVSDFNNDGYPDIYISNDFHEDDYYYLNNGDGTFIESLKQYFGHTSMFSMGNDVADINHDGYLDVMSLDMLPEDEKVLKSSIGDYTPNKQHMRVNNLGYHYQYSRNMLQLNNQGNSFSEVALQSGVAATDWSWSVLFSDYNQDGEQDIFISNGIPKRPNDLDYVNFISSDVIKSILNDTKLLDEKALAAMPSGEVPNYIFQGSSLLSFSNKSDDWLPKEISLSNGAAYGDLDNDGDLDIVTNNLNDFPSIYINKTNDKASYLKLKLSFGDNNKFGIGTKVNAFSNGKMQSKELYPARGFQSSSEPIIHFGFGNKTKVDSLEIYWPNNTKQILKNVDLNKTLQVAYSIENVKPVMIQSDKTKLFNKVDNNLGIDFKHIDNDFIDFDIQKLIPSKITNRGTSTTIADINNDGKEDVIFGGSNYNNGAVFLQKELGYIKDVDTTSTIFCSKTSENVELIVEDFNGDKKLDVFTLNGGGLLDVTSDDMLDCLYINEENEFVKKTLPEYFKNGLVAKSSDFDNDGDLDIFVGGGAIPNDYGKLATSFILKNAAGNFNLLKVSSLENIGMVTDAIWTDFDNDNLLDLILVGEWMQPKFLKNIGDDFIDVTKEKVNQNLNGLWQSIISFDIDHDGDEDYLLGNWGMNTKFNASNEFPLKLFYGDFDKNSKSETIIAHEKNGKYYPFASLDELSGQLVSLTKKKFPQYNKFAGKTIYEVFDKELLNNGNTLLVHTLKSGYLENNNGVFNFIPFTEKLQVAPLTSFLKYDFNKDNIEEILVGGNFFGVIPYQGKFDGFTGALITNNNDIQFGNEIGLDFSQKEIIGLNPLTIENKDYLLVTINNKKVEVYEIK